MDVYRLVTVVGAPFVRGWGRMRVTGLNELPESGPVLLVANHVSVLDPLACARLVWDSGRVPHFLAKESVFKGLAKAVDQACQIDPRVTGIPSTKGSLKG